MILNDILPVCHKIVESGRASAIYIGGRALDVTVALAQFIVKDPYILLGISLALAVGEFKIRGGEIVWDLSTGVWNSIVNNRLSQMVYLNWLKIETEPTTLWDAVIRRAQHFASGTAGGAVLSGIARSGLK